MTMDGKLLARARERLAARREANAAERDRREAEAYAKAPELRRIDADLRRLVGQVIGLNQDVLAAFQCGLITKEEARKEMKERGERIGAWGQL